MRKRTPTAVERFFVEERAKGCCEYCKFPLAYSHDAFHIEHIYPKFLGGLWSFDNLAFSCDGCNSKKWLRIEWADPETSIKTLLFHPRQDVWTEHFA